MACTADWILPSSGPNRQSRTASYLPIGDRPRSLLPRPTDTASILSATPSRRSNLSPDPQRRQYLYPSTVFNRQRSGSTPNPITVTRDSQDFNTYNLTLATSLAPPGSGSTATPTSAETDSALTLRVDGRGRGTGQTFPETPSAFSPMWSAASATGFAGPSPLGAGAPTTKHASLAQQMLLTRAATSVRGARAGVTRPRGLATSSMIGTVGTGAVPGSMSSHPYANSRNNMLAMLTPPPEETNEGSPEREEEEEVVESVPDPSVTDLPKEAEVANGPLTPQSQGSSSRQSDPHAQERPPVEGLVPSRSPSLNSSADTSNAPSTLHSKPSVVGRMLVYNNNESKDTLSSLSIDKPLPPRPMDSPDQEVGVKPFIEDAVVTATAATATAMGCGGVCDGGVCALCSGNGAISQDVPAPSTPPAQFVRTSPPVTTPRSLPPQPDSTQPTESTRVITPPATISLLPSSPPSSPPPRPVRRIPPTPHPPSLFNTNDRLPTNPLTLSLGAPPPYYSVVPVVENGITSSQRSEGSDRGAPSYSASSPPPSNANSGAGVLSPDSSSRNQRNGRTRPPLPVGPRKPTSQPNAFGSGSIDRNASVSSSGSGINGSAGGSRLSGNASLSGPRFQTPPVKWRGYTMDAAKWTFTSQQLQAIVSRAIRQSSEASSIRLLKLETLDNEIPDEMHRLDMLRMDVKARYKASSRKRYSLLATLSGQLERAGGEEVGDAVTLAQRLVEELAETSVMLDQLAEELHSVDEQMAQLKSLRDIHSASALAMALRKLNSSFSKQLAEMQGLRRHVESLEAERDDAWKEAHEAANDYDDLNDHLRALEVSTPNTAGSFTNYNSRRSSRVMAARMSSVRVSRAGLRPSRSQRSSVSSIYKNNTVSSARSTFHSIVVPPVPPMPPHRPPGIVTADLPPSGSFSICPTKNMNEFFVVFS
jgi:hypothetical protein